MEIMFSRIYCGIHFIRKKHHLELFKYKLLLEIQEIVWIEKYQIWNITDQIIVIYSDFNKYNTEIDFSYG